MNIFKKRGKITPIVVIFTMLIQMLVGVVPVFAATGPVLDGYSISPDNGTATSTTPSLWTHVINPDLLIDITKCQYQYSTDIAPNTGWLNGMYYPDVMTDGTPVIGQGACMSPTIDVTGASQFSGELRLTNALGNFTDSGVITWNISTVVPVVSVQSVITDNNPLPILNGTIDDPAAYVWGWISNVTDPTIVSYFNGINNGDGTWSAPVMDVLPVGSYIINVTADNLVNLGYTSGSYTVTSVPAVTYTLIYIAGANGSILGVTPQTVNQLADGSTVTAIPNPGYQFSSWSDGVITASRTDIAVSANISVTANFTTIITTTTPTITVTGSPATVLSGAITPADFTYTITNTTASPYNISYWWMSISNIRKTEIKTFNYINGTTVTSIAIPNETCDWMGNNCRLEIFNLPVNTSSLAVGETVSFHFQIAFNNVSPTVPETHGIFLGAVDGAMTSFSNNSASFTVNNPIVMYNANFVVDGVTTTIPTNYGSAIAVPISPTKPGYTFTGWSPTVPATMPANDVTFVAQWTINSYTITFNSDGGTAVADIVANYGSAITAPIPPTKTGYTFVGWSTAFPATMPLGGASLTAQWSINSYNANFVVDGVTTTIPTNYGSAIAVPISPTKPDYTFTGWSPTVPAIMPASNQIFVAQWREKVSPPIIAPVITPVIPADPIVVTPTLVDAVDVETLATNTQITTTSDIPNSTHFNNIKSSDTELKDATDKKDSDWEILGLDWYWWLIIVALAASIWWFIATLRRKNKY